MVTGRSKAERAMLAVRRQVWGIDAARQQTVGDMVAFLGRRSLHPVQAAVQALEGIRRYGGEARRVTGMSRLRQLPHLCAVIASWHLSIEEYYRYRLFMLPVDRSAFFVPLRHHILLRRYLYNRLGIDEGKLSDKRRFGVAAGLAGLPVPRIIAAFDNGKAEWTSTPRDLPDDDLFMKPATNYGGEGAGRWTRVPGGYRGEDGVVVSPEGLVASLCELSRSGPYILQQRLRTHPALEGLGPNALCTVRVVTSRHWSGTPEILLALLRMPRGDAPVDNFAFGGLASAVDIETGRLDSACVKALSAAIRNTSYDRHPDTGAPIAGFVLPDWNRIKDVCLSAHRAFPEFPSVGWDVGLTEEGPMLIEGNYNWDVVLAQQPGQRALGATLFSEHFLSFLNAAEVAGARRQKAEELVC